MKRLCVAVFCLMLVVYLRPDSAAAGENMLMMATTTSTDNTGLLDYLAPKFKEATGIELKWTATGTGKALKLGENCDVDILMVHAPPAEKKFVADGFGTERLEIMYNDFVIIGPESDPAGIKGKSIKDAFATLKTKQAVFTSRGDNSGTHKKELSLWKAADLPVPEKESWYVQTGQGMLATINIAAERNGYTMTDRGTYIKYESNLKGNPPLKILVEGDAVLLNQYSVIAVNPTHCAKANYNTAQQFIKWIAGPDAQNLIKEFKLLGKPLFTPNAKM
ncbi:MAG: substrate-binding domain-containing protein [Deltaproteobacteria bacterium]|jgi:tungstate transport system substrate-binding protein|nr:substrate-binding domain-containing protein [Deltaproteobacteria bacterium]MBW2517676.1 substrate-binding domain-containing protein [Deltaproteobacteria bacterium]